MEQIEAIILDEIINKILESKFEICYKDFKTHEHFKDLNENDLINEFQRLLSYIERNNYARINHSAYNFVSKNEYTKNFKDKGGFAKIYQDELTRLEKVQEKEKLETNIAKSNLEANELNKSIAAKNDKNEKKNTIGMWINIFIGVLNIVLIAIQIWLSSQKP